MSLIACAECAARISNQAAACPRCGAPVRRITDRPGIVTTQLTAKRYKGAQLAGAVLLAVGLVVVFQVPDSVLLGAGMAFAGLLLYIGARARAWWRHG